MEGAPGRQRCKAGTANTACFREGVLRGRGAGPQSV